MNLLSLFPTPVGLFNLNREITKEELAFVKGLEMRPNMGNTTSVENYILKKKELKGIKKFIEESLEQYFISVFQPQDTVKLCITQSWINFSTKGQWHHKHAHPNSFVSGVFYFSANERSDKIYFSNEGYQRIKLNPKEYNAYNSETWWLEANTGRLIIFPSELSHNVAPVEEEETRISLSFNTFPKGVIGENHSLTEFIANW